MTLDDIRQALRDCYDPVLRCNIVDLGLIERIVLAPDLQAPGAGIPGVPPKYRVTLTLLPTTQDETQATHLVAHIANRLAGFEALSGSTVTLLESPAWSPLRISPAGRRQLGLDGHPHLVQITHA